MALSNIVSPNESLGRYLTDKNYFSRMNKEVKFKAFMPPLDKCLSVYRIDGLQLDEIWDIGQNMVVLAMPQPRKLYGVADIKAGIVEREKLEIDPDDVPPRHANIIGWPEDQAQQMSIAQGLAAEAILVLKE